MVHVDPRCFNFGLRLLNFAIDRDIVLIVVFRFRGLEISFGGYEIFASAGCDPLPHQWLDDSESYYILYPDQPFEKGTEYRVRISGAKGGQPLTFDWTFTTEN